MPQGRRSGLRNGTLIRKDLLKAGHRAVGHAKLNPVFAMKCPKNQSWTTKHAGREVIMATGPRTAVARKRVSLAKEDLALFARCGPRPFQFDAQLLTNGTASAIASEPCIVF